MSPLKVRSPRAATSLILQAARVCHKCINNNHLYANRYRHRHDAVSAQFAISGTQTAAGIGSQCDHEEQNGLE